MPPHIPNKHPITFLTYRDFVFLQNAFRFGADPELTVITAYLQLTPTLIQVVKERECLRPQSKPAALIVAYDVADMLIRIICVDTNDTQSSVRLTAREVNELYRALNIAIRKKYRYTPEQQLNLLRSKYGLSALWPEPKARPWMLQ